MQPGDTVQPNDTQKPEGEGVLRVPRDSEPEAPEAEIPDLEEPTTVTEPEPDTPEPVTEPAEEATPPPQAESAEPSSWQYAPEADTEPSGFELEPISWTASEFVEHEKDASWFIGLGAITGLAVTITYLFTRELLPAIAIVLAGCLFGVTARRKPRSLEYQLNNAGVSVGGKFHQYDEIKSFSVLEEGAFKSIQLTPHKRFAMPITLYYPPENEEQIVTMLGSYLPHEQRSHDPVERLMHKVRF